MNSTYILSMAIYLSEVGAAFLGCAGGSLCLFTVGYTYANVVRYRNEHGGQLDLVEVLRQMSPSSAQTDEEDVEANYTMNEEYKDVTIIGDAEFV